MPKQAVMTKWTFVLGVFSDCRAVCHPDCKDNLPLPCVPTKDTPGSAGKRARVSKAPSFPWSSCSCSEMRACLFKKKKLGWWGKARKFGNGRNVSLALINSFGVLNFSSFWNPSSSFFSVAEHWQLEAQNGYQRVVCDFSESRQNTRVCETRMTRGEHFGACRVLSVASACISPALLVFRPD